MPPAPAGIPYSYEDHVKMMYDLLVLAYQANITRVITFMVAREISNRTYPQVGVPDGHHAISHHQNHAEKMDKNVKIQTYHIGLFSQFLEKMRTTPDGDGSLLDHSVLLYGSNMSNSNAHNHFPLPNLVVGGASGRLKGNRHLRYPDHTPMTNLLLARAGQGRRSTWKPSATARERWRSYERFVVAILLAALAAGADAQPRRRRESRRQGRRPGIAAAARRCQCPGSRRDDGFALGRRSNDDAELVDQLIRAGANVKAANRYGITPLYLACVNGNAAMIEKLLKAGRRRQRSQHRRRNRSDDRRTHRQCGCRQSVCSLMAPM